MPYLNVVEVESALAVASGPPNAAFTQLITLPNLTWEGRQSHAIKLANGAGAGRPGVYFIGGVHAREWGSSDILINFVEVVAQAFRTNSGITLGGKSFTAPQIQTLVNNLDVFVFPQVNPDGRNVSMNSDAMWRKNRRVAAPSSAGCPGVDINRNYDFLWNYPVHFSPSSGVMNSTNPCDYQVYIGPSAASEPETKNVVSIIDSHPDIGFFIDVHSYGEDILHNWGDDENQTTDPSMNFLNPAHDGTRGKAGDAYREFIPASDQSLSLSLANAMKTAIQAVRGRLYTVKSSFNLYPTAGTSEDYCFSRHFADASKGRIIGYTIEWGSGANPTPFHPPYAEMQKIIEEITAALIQFCIDAEASTHNTAPAVDLGPDLTANEGAVVTVTAVITDPDAGDVLQVTISWGDGTPDTVLTGASAGVSTVQHIYADEGSYTVTVTVTDAAGASGSDTLTVNVINVGPTVAPPAFVPAQAWPGQDVVMTVQFTDPGWKDAHTAQVDWGDGTPASPVDSLTETNTAPQAVGTATAHHKYALPGTYGTYAVTVCVTDEDGATSCATASIKVELSPAMPGMMDTTNNLNFLTWTGALPGTIAAAESQWRAGHGVAALKWIYEADGWLYFFQVTPGDLPNFNPNLPEAIPGNWLAIAVPKDLFQRWFWCGIRIVGPSGQTTIGCHPQYGPPPEGAGLLHPWVTARIAVSQPHIVAVLEAIFG